MKKTLLFVLGFGGFCLWADVTLPDIFSHNAVLQKSKATAIFGKAEPGSKISVTYGKSSGSAVAGKDGKSAAVFICPYS